MDVLREKIPRLAAKSAPCRKMRPNFPACRPRRRRAGRGALYFHSFCPGRCLYCSFVSQNTEREGKLLASYLPLLHKELYLLKDTIEKLSLSLNCVYIGGGTPTALLDEDFEALLELVSALFLPPSVRSLPWRAGGRTPSRKKARGHEKIRGLPHQHQPQTMNDETLRRIGRRHTAEDVKRAFSLSRDMGFDNINADLIAGLPGKAFRISKIPSMKSFCFRRKISPCIS
jgi:oxygen-independent coproporphyrinogen-3 oxidase